MTMSVPIVYKLWRKAPMRQAVKDIVEVCSHARARAILQGQVTEVVFHPKQNRLSWAAAAECHAARCLERGSLDQRSTGDRVRLVGTAFPGDHHRNAGYQHVRRGV